jgi:hypothetical protein
MKLWRKELMKMTRRNKKTLQKRAMLFPVLP